MRLRLASLLLLCSAVASAQPGAITTSTPADAGPQTAITTNPVELVFGVANVAIEHALTRHVSLEIEGLHMADSQIVNQVSARESVDAVTIHPHFYLFNDHALSGFYLAPFVQVMDVEAERTDGGSATGAGVALGTTLGWAWVTDHMDIELGAGAEVLSETAEGHGPDAIERAQANDGVGLTMDLSMGVAF
jgi:hypothetical protein